ncbi:MAG: tetratricopeptide repeat protein [Sandaracinaceae bacterium]
MARLLPLLLLLPLAAACGSGQESVRYGRTEHPTVTGENLHELDRTYWRTDPSDPGRLALRDALVAYRARDAETWLEDGDYDRVVSELAALAVYLTPADVEANQVPAELEPLARFVVERGSPRGDEGRVMAGLRLLAAIDEGEREAYLGRRESIATWGVEARQSIENPIGRYGDLLSVWERHDELAPAPDVLRRLAELHDQQHDALVPLAADPRSGVLDPRQQRLAVLVIQRSPLDVAAVYLRHGLIDESLRAVEALGDGGGLASQLIALLRTAREASGSGAQALEELAGGFARARPAITAAVCRYGLRRNPDRAEFPLCLARVAHDAGSYGEATGWYREAIRLRPVEREVYDEALGRLGQAIEAGLFEVDATQTRVIARIALEILEERQARWPGDPPPVSRDLLLLQLGRAEMSAGHPDQAERALKASIDSEASAEAHQQLGLLLVRVGRPMEAVPQYEAALELTGERGAESRARRAELQELLGDAHRDSNDATKARAAYREALRIWEDIGRRTRQEAQAAVVLVRQGILLDRLGRRREAQDAFARTLQSAPAWREPYAAILSHLVVTQPDLELAQRVLRRAQFQLSLGAEWKVYFALWVQAIAARAAGEPEGDVQQLFADLARGRGWPAMLAAFGERTLDFDGLIEAAADPGQLAEAHFYEGTRLLGAGDRAGARERFQAVIASGMGNFYEYAMAQELLRTLGQGDEAGEGGQVVSREVRASP